MAGTRKPRHPSTRHSALSVLSRPSKRQHAARLARPYLGSPAHGIPAQPTPLIGREQEVRLVRDQLAREDVRLLTLTGPAGTGKTRLALQAAVEMSPDVRDGAVLVNLAPISDARLVTSEIARALGIREERGGIALLDSLKLALREKQLLLVLDNFEQVTDAAPQIADLLAACPALKVLSTSRATLRLRWEHELAVPPLQVPDLSRLPALDQLARVPSTALFIARAQAVNPEFRLTSHNAAAVAELCVRLDGLPLAIELAAARVKLFSPASMLARLEQRFDLLRADTLDRPDRHQTLRAALDWSYQLLPPNEQRLLRVLSVFVGGCTLEAVAEVAESPSIDGVASLIDKSLLRQAQPGDGETRCYMLETVRQYALEQLAHSGELDEVLARHAGYCLRLAETAEPALVGPDQVRWLEQLDREHDNLRAALRWWIERRDAEMAARLGAALWRFWSIRGYPREGRVWIAEVLRAVEGTRDDLHAKVLSGAGRLAYDQGDYAAARALYQQSLDIRRELGDTRLVAHSLGHLGEVAHQTGDYGAAEALFVESLAMLRALEDSHGVAETLDKLGLTVRCLGDYPRATALYEEALAICRQLGDRAREALILNNVGRVAYYQADYQRARAFHQDSLAIRRQVGDRRGMATSLSDLGDVAQEQGAFGEARGLRAEALRLWQQLEDPWGLAYVLESFAGYAAAVDQPQAVVELVGAASVLRDSIHAPRSPGSAERIQLLVNAAMRRMGRQAAAEAWATGQLLTNDEAVAVAQQLAEASSGPRDARSPAQALLSPREREVVTLITRGLTNRQIADALVIGERTVHTHVANVMAKLELSSRTQIATWGVEQGLR
ncbi:MAG TPA: tetratricopeptide repeat protein [Chloroflexota bacterium]|nr:tetratricopeptide repeat protein [Chloroflexota bacterium]